jgi:hypothetical protein
MFISPSLHPLQFIHFPLPSLLDTWCKETLDIPSLKLFSVMHALNENR